MLERVIKPWGVTVLNALHRRCEDRFWSSCIWNGLRIRYDVYLGRIFIFFLGGGGGGGGLQVQLVLRNVFRWPGCQ